MRTLPLHLDAGSDVRQSLETLAREQGATGYVLSVVGNLSAAVFQCPGKPAPTRLRGELEIITLSGTLSPEGVHLHLSFSDGDCRVWGGHLEPGTLVLRGADLLVGFLETAAGQPVAGGAAASQSEPGRTDSQHSTVPASAASGRARSASGTASSRPQTQLEVAVLPGCPWSARALRLLRTLSIPHRVIEVDSDTLRAEIQQRCGSASLPQLFLDGAPIGGYDALAERHGRGELEALRQG